MPDIIAQNLTFIIAGLKATAQLALVGIVGGTLLGLVLGALRYSAIAFLGQVAAVYIEVVRGTPLLVVLLMCFFGFPALLGYRTEASSAASLGFVLFIAAYLAEDFRSGLLSVRPGLVQAGLATGLTKGQVFRLILFPQAVRRLIPAFVSQYIRLFKFTSVASVIGVRELTGSALLVNAREFQPVTILASVAATYLVICTAMSLLGRLLYARIGIRT
jgi:His/Glu/Gln/Arg/opine family amino acid ABC transporter permease subunit